MRFFRRGGEVSRGLGGEGERLALRHLKRKGLKLLARNYRCPCGEVDLIVLDKTTRHDLGAETIAFVEVKARSSNRYTAPEGAVNNHKRKRIEKVAQHYLSTRSADAFNVRFDIVSVLLRDGQSPEIEHIPDAF